MFPLPASFQGSNAKFLNFVRMGLAALDPPCENGGGGIPQDRVRCILRASLSGAGPHGLRSPEQDVPSGALAMPIPFTCPHCGLETTVADQYAGQTGPCSRCGKPITIPGTPGAPGTPFYPPPKPASKAPILIIALAVAVPVVLVCGGILVALLLPAVQAAREAARRGPVPATTSSRSAWRCSTTSRRTGASRLPSLPTTTASR